MRGDIAASVPRTAVKDVAVRNDDLEFKAAGELVVLTLGAADARRWAQAMLAPLPTLAHKLGITDRTRLYLCGDVDDDELREAVGLAATTAAALGAADFAILRTDDATELEAFACEAARDAVPAWIVYEKGARAPLGETAVREIMRRRGFIDVKIARVSQRLTALRFLRKA